MNDTDNSSKKTFGGKGSRLEHKLENPIKKCHLLDGKYFIVIDQLIVEKVMSSGIDETELYFQQELTKDGSVVLHPFKIGT